MVAAWGPDPVSRLIEGAYEIFTIKPDGTSLKRLTSTHGNDAHEAWSPDGEYIVFANSRMGFKDEAMYTDAPQPYGEIFVMRYDGSGVEYLTDNQWEEGNRPGSHRHAERNLSDKRRMVLTARAFSRSRTLEHAKASKCAL